MSEVEYKLAMGQMLVIGGDVAGNLYRAVGMIVKAAKAGCDIVVLPECLNVGWTDPAAQVLAEPIPGLFSDNLCKAARIAEIYVAVGLVERDGERLYNTAILIGPDGTILARHRKINELNIARPLYAIGDQLTIVPTRLGNIAINICADNLPDSLAIGHELADMGADILVSPSAWAVEADHDNVADPYGSLWQGSYNALATAHAMPVIGVSNVGPIEAGPWEGRKCIGCSLAVGSDGSILARGPYGVAAEELIVVPIKLQLSHPLPTTSYGPAITRHFDKAALKG